MDSGRTPVRSGQLRRWRVYPDGAGIFLVLEPQDIHLPAPRGTEQGWMILDSDSAQRLLFEEDVLDDSELVQEADDG